MLRRALILVLIGSLVVPSGGWAAAVTEDEARQSRASSSGKRAVWALIGAGLGFGAGLILGLRWFDDAPHSDRKVWTTAIITAVAGGVAGGVLSGQVDGIPHRAPPPPTSRQLLAAPVPERQLPTASGSSASDADFVARVRAANASLGLVGPEHADGFAPARRVAPVLAVGSGAARPGCGTTTNQQQPEAKAPKADSLRNGMIVGSAVGAVVGLWYVPEKHCKPAINPECPRLLRIAVGIPAIASGAALGALIDRLIR